jgi:aryl-alcohol dehydrogenase-like predicted oxidoreductase
LEYTNLGSSGLKVSRVGLGTMGYGSKKWREYVLDEEESRPFIQRALEVGINFFDTADMYSLGASEEVLGRALKDFSESRERVVIGTKVFNPMGEAPNQRGLSRKHLFHAIDDSLRRLGTDYIDLYQIHRFDPDTPIEETMEALDDIVRAGKALYVGASSMFAWQFARFLAVSDRRNQARFVSMQNFYNLLYREEEREMNPLCRAEGIGLIPWSPLAQGALTGIRKGSTSRSQNDSFTQKLYGISETTVHGRELASRLEAIGRERGVPPAQIAIAWLLHQPGVAAPIVGASKPHHIDDAVAAVSLKLSAEEIFRLSETYTPQALI